MKKQLYSVLFLFLAYSGHGLAITAEDLTCVAKAGGYLPFNPATQSWIGSGHIFEKGVCNRALDSLRPSLGILCSWNSHGWNLFDAQTGKAIVESGVNWVSLSTCESAMYLSNQEVICAPRGTGSGVYDLKNQHFIGHGFYFDIQVCGQASYGAQPRRVCAPHLGYTAVFHRRYNQIVSDELYMTSHQCTKLLEVNHE